MMFTKNELDQIERHALTVDGIEKQLNNFREGFAFLSIVESASVGNGILSMDKLEAHRYIAEYRDTCNNIKVAKFVPASGAATRMMQDLFSFIDSGKHNQVSKMVIDNLDRFAFSDQLHELLPEDSTDLQTISAIVGEGLEYGSKPKGLISFHKYLSGSRTAFEEHLCEGAIYANCTGKVHIHFTVSPEHAEGFRDLFNEVKHKYEQRYDVIFDFSMSYQKSSTDTIAVDMDNNPFRNEDGTLLFRPAGHGALIENLNDIDADIVFIKTIDNVTVDARKEDTIRNKEILAGVLLSLRSEISQILEKLEGNEYDDINYQDILRFIEDKLYIRLPDGFGELPVEELRGRIRGILNRPIRVCGMVCNEGEPGGGPFWARNDDGTISLQIAESAQIAPKDSELMKTSTHFNPVDLVCYLKDYNDIKFDLREFTDPKTGLISQKSKSGRELKAQELPGLWNGAMANWNTIFVEVPITTFSPVKVVTDLLRPQHQ